MQKVLTKSRKAIPLSRIYTKAAYARKIKKSQTWVNKLILKGALQELTIQGGSLVCEN